MTEIKPKIILDEKPAKMIRWFSTRTNWTDEICALLVGQIEQGNIHVTELLFPKQQTGCATVSFTQEDWNNIIKEHPNEKIQKIIGYWHRHPGGTTASGHDETETIDVFMTPESGRKTFCFLISAPNCTNAIDIEGRIEIRGDINASIESDVTVYQDMEIAETCQKIIKECVKPKTSTITIIKNGVSETVTCLADYLNGKREATGIKRTGKYNTDSVETGLEITRTSGVWTIKTKDEFFPEAYGPEFLEAENKGMIKEVESSYDGTTKTYTLTFKGMNGYKKKIRDWMKEIQKMYEEEINHSSDDIRDLPENTPMRDDTPTIIPSNTTCGIDYDYSKQKEEQAEYYRHDREFIKEAFD